MNVLKKEMKEPAQMKIHQSRPIVDLMALLSDLTVLPVSDSRILPTSDSKIPLTVDLNPADDCRRAVPVGVTQVFLSIALAAALAAFEDGQSRTPTATPRVTPTTNATNHA